MVFGPAEGARGCGRLDPAAPLPRPTWGFRSSAAPLRDRRSFLTWHRADAFSSGAPWTRRTASQGTHFTPSRWGRTNGDLFTHVIAFRPGSAVGAEGSGAAPASLSHTASVMEVADRFVQPEDRPLTSNEWVRVTGSSLSCHVVPPGIGVRPPNGSLPSLSCHPHNGLLFVTTRRVSAGRVR